VRRAAVSSLEMSRKERWKEVEKVAFVSFKRL
jgi:hypothetical protein